MASIRRLSLLNALVLVVLIGVTVYYLPQTRRDRLYDQGRRLGWSTYIDSDGFIVRAEMHSSDPLSPGAVEFLRDCPHLTKLDLENNRAPSDVFPNLGCLHGLTDLTLDMTRVSDFSFLTGHNFPLLATLKLENTAVSDEAMASIATLGELVDLDVASTGVSDRGIRMCKRCGKLRRINLTQTHVTIDGIRILYELPTIKTIAAYDTKVSEADIAPLKAAHPDVQIYIGQ